MRIVYLATSDMALRYLLLDQMRFVQAQGHSISAVSAPGPWVEAVRAAGIPVHTIPFTRRMSPIADLRAAAALLWHLVRVRPDLVHTHTPKAALIGQWVAIGTRVPHRVHTIFGLYFPAAMRPDRRWFYVLLERLQNRPPHLVFSQNAEDIETCRVDRICDTSKMRLLGNGIDISAFSADRTSPQRRAEIRRAIGVPEGDRVVGVVSRLVREKGYVELFSAARSVVARHPRTTFLIVGDPDDQKDDRFDPQDPAVLALGDRVRMLGHRDDVADLYAVMDVFVHPSHREGFPRAPMEAAASGVPVIATDIRGSRETVIDGKSGLLVPARDAGALADAVTALLDDDERRTAMGRAGRALAEERFDQQRVFERIVASYAELGRA